MQTTKLPLCAAPLKDVGTLFKCVQGNCHSGRQDLKTAHSIKRKKKRLFGNKISDCSVCPCFVQTRVPSPDSLQSCNFSENVGASCGDAKWIWIQGRGGDRATGWRVWDCHPLLCLHPPRLRPAPRP